MQLDAQQRIASFLACDDGVPPKRRTPPPRALGAVDDALARHLLAARQAHDLAQRRRVLEAFERRPRLRAEQPGRCDEAVQWPAVAAEPGDAGVGLRSFSPRLLARPRSLLRRAYRSCGAAGRAGRWAAGRRDACSRAGPVRRRAAGAGRASYRIRSRAPRRDSSARPARSAAARRPRRSPSPAGKDAGRARRRCHVMQDDADEALGRPAFGVAHRLAGSAALSNEASDGAAVS